MKKRYSLLAALVLTAPLLATGCSSGGDDTGDKAAVTTDDGSTTTDGTNGSGGDETTTTTTKDGGGKVNVSAEAAPYVKAMAASISKSQDDGDLQMTPEQADCIAPRWVNTIGVDRFKEAGITPEAIEQDDKPTDFEEFTLTKPEAEVMYDAFGQCNVNLRELMLESLAGDAEVPEAVRTCMEGVLTEKAIKKLMILGLTEGDTTVDNPNDMPPELAGIMGCAFLGMGSGDDSVDSGSTSTTGN